MFKPTKQLLLAGASALAMLVCVAEANAETFTVPGGVFTAPRSSEYAIELLGASGGNSSGNKGGLGAEVEAEEFIPAGFSFDLFVGQMGFSSGFGGGGGGGSFIVSGNVIVFAAGGGGGAGDSLGDGGPGQAGTDGQAAMA
jgi:hypothetical protein